MNLKAGAEKSGQTGTFMKDISKKEELINSVESLKEVNGLFQMNGNKTLAMILNGTVNFEIKHLVL